MNKKILFFLTLNILLSTCLYSQLNDKEKNKELLLKRFYDLAKIDPDKAVVVGDSIKSIPFIIKGDKMKFYETLGLSYFFIQNYSKSYINFIKSLDEAIEQKKYSNAGRTHIDISNIFFDLKDTASVNKHYKLALQFYKKADDRAGILDVIQAKAFSESDNGNFEKSISILKKYQTEVRKSTDTILYLIANYMFLDNYLQLNKKEEAFKYLDTIKSQTKDKDVFEFKYYRNLSYMQVSSYLINKNELDATDYYLEKIDKEILDFDSFVKIEYYKLLSLFHEKNGDTEMYQKVNDTLFSIQQKVIADNGKVDINIVEEKNKIEEYLKNNKIKSNTKYSFIFILLFTILIIVFFAIKKVKKLKNHTEKLEKELPKKYSLIEEKEKFRITLKEKNKKIEGFKKEIKSISKLSDSVLQREKIKELSKNIIIESLKNTNKVENIYEELKQVNPLFFEKLHKSFPTLNTSEKTICYYIHIDFKNKEIAEFLNTSIRSVESRRYRIGKKIIDTTLEKGSIKEALNTVVSS